MFVAITGCRWTELSIQYGSKSTAHKRFQDLQQKGVWKKILKSASNNISAQAKQTKPTKDIS